MWDKIAPGLASDFDAPYTIPAIAPRPLLILNGTILSPLKKYKHMVAWVSVRNQLWYDYDFILHKLWKNMEYSNSLLYIK